MKALILAAAAALTLTAAQAQDCKMIGDLAEKTMEARQVGVPMSKMMEIAKDDRLLKTIIIDAYKKPRFSTDEFQRSATVDFRADWEVACYEVKNKKGGSNV